jgi:PPOX class probable F420-dependent enzyme
MDQSPTLAGPVRAFLTERNRFAVIATVDPDGGPRQAVTWIAFDADGTVWVNSRRGRRWPANLERERRASIAILELEDPDRWVGLTCVVEEIVDDVERAREDIVALAHRYHPEGPDPADIAGYRSQPRVMFRLRITAVHDHLVD